MRVLLDDQAMELTETSVRCAIETAREAVDHAGRIIVDVLADGAPIDGAVLETPPSDAGGINELRFVSADRGALVEVTLRDAADALADAATFQSEASAALDRGDQAEASEKLGHALSTWQLVGDVVEKSGLLLGLDPGSVAFDVDGTGRDGKACIASLQGRLTDVAEALRASDWAAVSDIIGLDMDEEIAAWQAFMHAMADRARA